MSRMSKQEKGWVLYDWANSAYSILITTAIFPLYFKAAANDAGLAATTSTAYWGYANSFATLLISLCAPILGSIADFKGLKKRLFTFFFVLGIVFTLLLAVVPSNQWLILLICYMVTVIGFGGTNIFYDAFLVDVTTEDRMNQISSKGYAMGYIGSTIPFIISIALIILSQQNILPLSVTVASQAAFAITALWWGLFTIPMLKNVKQVYYKEAVSNPISNGFKQLFETFKKIKLYRPLFLFLIAYFFYIDGVNTIITMSTAYGSDLGITSTNLLIILFATQVVAAPFAILYGKLADKFKSKTMLLVGIFVYIVICTYAYFLKTTLDFWILAMLVASSQGGIQALSRSYFAKLVPKEHANEFFGFYSIFYKFAAILGPSLMGFTAYMTGNTNSGVFSLIVLFIIGGIILLRVPESTSISQSNSISQ
ncbi:MFS transporter [Bacillus sp. ISL-40]|uniref:MFS transporter n=1 Tax=unclassified Bacillus (in: firmicutes) TaxID=185979 RepID=UPI001BE56727|nr:MULTISPECIES: MFS transporter [unclassified Bacillus (in: firmicutes)]MBT2696259.1 MFS transporter [Bacillus sp. ISL-40]MBT2720415.1 MFS transporter [Bacillus sp. ISL-46]MBT2743108.1 MFS transporter [Bacillus sp. ISL-77]